MHPSRGVVEANRKVAMPGFPTRASRRINQIRAESTTRVALPKRVVPPTPSLDRFYALERPYDRENYNCAHFAARVWHELTGGDISMFTGLPNMSHRARLARLEKPQDPCVAFVYFSAYPHVGIFMRNGVLHFNRFGVRFENLHHFSYLARAVRFYVTTDVYSEHRGSWVMDHPSNR